MLTIPPAIGPKEIATLLQERRENNQRIVLFLGSRTSGWMRNSVFYDNVGQFGNSDFYSLDSAGKFGRCHKILSDKRFQETDIHQMLVTAIKDLPQREEDDWLVDLLKEELFDVILSTSIDDFIENACLRAGMEEEQDFHVLHPLRDTNQILTLPGSERLTIVKVFGDLGSRCYTTAGKELNCAAYPVLQELLASLLAQEMLMVGYDPIWDKAVEQIFPATGEVVYYVDEQGLADDAPLHQIILQRYGRYCVGNHHSYRGFMKTLHRSFTHQILSWPSAAAHREPTAGRQEQPAPSSPPQAPTRRKQKRPAPSSLHQEPTTSKQEQLAPSSPLQAPIRRKREKKTVFISYCHEDKRFLEELLPHLDIYEQQGLIGVWSDRNIEVGAGWRKEIEEALEAAEVAILMISKYFLASKFIKKVELPHLLEAAKQRGLVIIPVILSPCVFGDSQLHQFQTINSPDRPVSKIRHKLDQDELWVKVAKKVKEVSG